MLAIALSLVAALSWGTADFLGGLAARRRPLLAVMVLSQAAGLVVLVAVALPQAGAAPSGAHVAWAVVAGLFGVVALSLLYLGLAIGVMSVVAPIVALSATVPVVFSVLSGDALSALVAAGLALAIGGAGLSSAAAPEQHDDRPVQRGRSLWCAVGAALGFGGALITLDAAADGGALWTAIIARTCAVAAVTAALAARRVPLDLRAPGLGRVVVLGVLDATSMTLFALASNEGMLAVVAVLSSLYPVVTVILARAVLGERMRGVQLAGVGLAFAGIAAVTAGT